MTLAVHIEDAAVDGVAIGDGSSSGGGSQQPKRKGGKRSFQNSKAED